ncbi:kelch-like protein 3 isoform X2 [Cephus cinctus]|uniref:Kelch-like protein 3 isoform X2 n=1 Tax=Cephus cinctus TaxID=211228 RepID=A0AAJ7RJN1_CEPCN|nr:kelch-like protein 3 isoform X2 [Cephus cinctus]
MDGISWRKIVKNETFSKLSSQELMELISNDHLAVPSEEIVFESVISWVKYKQKERLQYFAELMKQVRLPLIPKMYLIENVWEEPIFKANSQCKDYLIEAMGYHLLKRAGQFSSKIPGIRPREPHELPKLLIIIGGRNIKTINGVEYFDFRTKLWHKAVNFQKGFCNSGVTVLEGKIYAVGGCNLTEAPLRTMHVYDVSADHWSACTGMKIKRMNFGVVTLDDCIYAIGGRDQKTIYSSAEVYNPKTCKWTIIPPMNVARSFFTVAVLNGRIYVIGGFAGKDKLPLSSVECYNPETGQWIFVADLNIRRQTASAGVLKGILYVVGGAVAITNVLKSVEVFDPNTNIWTFIEEMPGPRHHAGVVCLNEELYVVGGSDGTVDLRSICVYNPKKRAWIIYPTYMSIGRSQGGVIAVDIPHNYI